MEDFCEMRIYIYIEIISATHQVTYPMDTRIYFNVPTDEATGTLVLYSLMLSEGELVSYYAPTLSPVSDTPRTSNELKISIN